MLNSKSSKTGLIKPDFSKKKSLNKSNDKNALTEDGYKKYPKDDNIETLIVEYISHKIIEALSEKFTLPIKVPTCQIQRDENNEYYLLKSELNISKVLDKHPKFFRNESNLPLLSYALALDILILNIDGHKKNIILDDTGLILFDFDMANKVKLLDFPIKELPLYLHSINRRSFPLHHFIHEPSKILDALQTTFSKFMTHDSSGVLKVVFIQARKAMTEILSELPHLERLINSFEENCMNMLKKINAFCSNTGAIENGCKRKAVPPTPCKRRTPHTMFALPEHTGKRIKRDRVAKPKRLFDADANSQTEVEANDKDPVIKLACQL